MATSRDIAFLFHERYWNVIRRLPSRRKMDDVSGALVQAFFTGKSQCDRFKGELLTTYMQLEEQVFFSKAKAEDGRLGGKSKRKAKPQAEVEANIEANYEADAEANSKQTPKPKTKTNKKEKINKKENESTPQSTSRSLAICPKCKTERDSISPGVFRCPECDITWTVRAG